jgi:lipopolysaccharide transport system ATP-binding protein
MEPIISVRGLSKCYRVGQHQTHGSLRESLTSGFRLSRRWKVRDGDSEPHIWALREVNFDVKPGEVVGLIGSNGAGKSTALKILSRITRPTTGRAEICGRVRSLLEVGTGFHPELSGRENVFLNGAILGMRRGEIARKFDAIVSFAEVEKFIDTAVKHYSSGMYVRLAFAVAAYLEPEILLVDEVLAVGDNRFWQKSTDKMRELNARGMTIILVTHNMWLAQTVCTRGILLTHGRVTVDGRPQLVIDAYRRAAESAQERNGPRGGQDDAEITSLEILPVGKWASEREATPESGLGLSFTARVSVDVLARLFIRVASADGFPFYTMYSEVLMVSARRPLSCKVTIPRLMLKGGDYCVWVGLCSEREQEDLITQAHVTLVVKDPDSLRAKEGVFWNRADWNIR